MLSEGVILKMLCHDWSMNTLTALLIGIAGSLTGAPLVSFLKHRFSKSQSKDEYRAKRVQEWKLMVNQTKDVYPRISFTSFDQYPSLAEFLSDDQKKQVEKLNLAKHSATSQISSLLAERDSEFMNAYRMLKAEISRVERDVWNLI